MGMNAMAGLATIEGISAGERLILWALAYHADDYGQCWPSRVRIQQLTGIIPCNQSRLFRSLEHDHKLLWRHHRGGTSTIYTLLWDMGGRHDDTPGGITTIPEGYHHDTQNQQRIFTLESTLRSRPEKSDPEDPEMKLSDLAGTPEQKRILKEGKTAEDLLLQRKKHPPSPPKRLDVLWKSLCPGFTPNLTAKELGQLKHIQTKVTESRVRDLLQCVVPNWEVFAHTVKGTAGLKTVPSAPNIGFLLRHAGAAVDFMIKQAAQPVVPGQVHPATVEPMKAKHGSTQVVEDLKAATLAALEDD